ncbi:hypothetical protein GCM10027093_14140 [Paraburkholderia jirisanensis]
MLLAACSSAPQKTVRSSSGNAAASTTARTFRPPPGFPDFVDHSVGREEISIQAMSLVGVPYRWGGNTPDSGFDCSGLVHYVVQRAATVNLPRTTADMSSRGTAIEPDEIAAGDLIFFNTTGRPHSHVGIYVGKLRFVNAPSTGGTVRLDYLTNPYWAKRFDGIRRVAPPLAPPKPTPFEAPTYDAAAPPPADVDVAVGATAVGVGQTTTGAPAGTSTAAMAQRVAGERGPLTAQREAADTGSRMPVGATGGATGATGSPMVAAGAPARPGVASANVAGANVAGAGMTGASVPREGVTREGAAAPGAANSGAATAAYAAAGSASTNAAAADQFEPPPPALSAAQSQARAAGAVAPAVVTAGQAASGAGKTGGGAALAAAPTRDGASAGYAQQPIAPTRLAAQPQPAVAPDAIDAAADAYEPAPPAAVAARQAQQAQGIAPSAAPAPAWQQRPAGNVQIMRASTVPQRMPAPTQTNDDPIAGFASGRY